LIIVWWRITISNCRSSTQVWEIN